MSGILYEVGKNIPKCDKVSGTINEVIYGGTPLVVGNPLATDFGLDALTLYATGGKQVAIAYVCTKPLDAQGYPVRTIDRREYAYQANRIIDAFIPEVNVEFGVIGANITGGTSAVGKFLEPANGSKLFASNDTQTADVPSFEVVRTYEQPFENGTFEGAKETVYVVRTRYNG